MKAAFGAELIGLDTSTDITARMLGMNREFNRMNRPWVAELVALSERYGYARAFVRHKADYRQANSRGTRGIWFWWTLESGRVYEAKYRVTRSGGWVHRFVTVTDDGDIKDLTEEEVKACLSKDSASTS